MPKKEETRNKEERRKNNKKNKFFFRFAQWREKENFELFCSGIFQTAFREMCVLLFTIFFVQLGVDCLEISIGYEPRGKSFAKLN